MLRVEENKVQIESIQADDSFFFYYFEATKICDWFC